MNEREICLDILQRVFRENAYISLVTRDIKKENLNMAFVSEVVYGTVRNYRLLEFQWQCFVSRKVRLKTALLLDMSCYQLFFMNNEPEYAVVNEAVKAAGRKDGDFVNAILHKVLRQGFIHSPSFAIETSHPEWLINLWRAHYGEEIMQKTALADQKRPVVFGRINSLKTSRTNLEKENGFHFINDISFTYEGNLVKTSWFQNGEVLIQDIHSAETVQDLLVKPGMKVLDVCAAPGTKTQEAAAFMQNRGEITAGDLYPRRLQLIDQLMKKTGVDIVHSVLKDAAVKDAYPYGSFDRILCDVPCSGLGDLRHKPEIRLHITPEKIDALTLIQADILNNAAGWLKPGGILVYSTCTLNKKENERQIESFLASHPDFQLEKEVTRFPFEDDGDGFYHAVLRAER